MVIDVWGLRAIDALGELPFGSERPTSQNPPLRAVELRLLSLLVSRRGLDEAAAPREGVAVLSGAEPVY